MAKHIMITNFVDGSPQRLLIHTDAIVSITAFGTGMQSGTEVELGTGSVYTTSIWDTDWPTILRLAQECLDVVYVHDRRIDETSRELDADKQRLFGIGKVKADVEQTKRQQRQRRSTRSGRSKPPEEHVGERGTECALCEQEVDRTDLQYIPDGNDTMLVCSSCADVAVSAGDVNEAEVLNAIDQE